MFALSLFLHGRAFTGRYKNRKCVGMDGLSVVINDLETR